MYTFPIQPYAHHNRRQANVFKMGLGLDDMINNKQSIKRRTALHLNWLQVHVSTFYGLHTPEFVSSAVYFSNF